MKRRAFCSGGLAALTAAALPYRPLLADTPVADDTAAVGLDGRQVTLRTCPPTTVHGACGILHSIAGPRSLSAAQARPTRGAR